MIKIEVKASSAIKGLRNAGQLLKDTVRRTFWQEGSKYKKFAQSIAPQKTGALKRGIAFQAMKTKLKLMSTVPSSFPYNLWVNQDPGFMQLGPYKRANTKYGIRKGDVLVYGSSPKHFKWTGTPKFMQITAVKLVREFPVALNKNIQKVFGKI